LGEFAQSALQLPLLRTGGLKVIFTQELMLNPLKVTVMKKSSKLTRLGRYVENADLSVIFWEQD
jgi:hypothetical protein